jgi:hypothetical protein
MNKLELCQELIAECGISGTETMTTTVSQTGEFADVVRWIDKAYEFIQNLHPNWQFLRFDFTFSTAATTQTYTPASANATDHAKWRVEKGDSFRCFTGSGSNEIYLDFVPWDDFRLEYLFSGTRTVTGRPVKFTIKPDQSLMFWPIPDAVYTVTGEYWKKAQKMSTGGVSVDSSVPVFPDRFHRAIVYKAMQYFGVSESSPEHFGMGDLGYKEMIGELRQDQLPVTESAPPLA